MFSKNNHKAAKMQLGNYKDWFKTSQLKKLH